MFIVYAALLPARNKLTAPDVTPLRARRGALEGISISSQRGSYSRRCHRDAALQDLAARAVPETRSPPRKTSSAPLAPPNCATDVGSQPTMEHYKIVVTSARVRRFACDIHAWSPDFSKELSRLCYKRGLFLFLKSLAHFSFFLAIMSRMAST
jgi:hypothetical protein